MARRARTDAVLGRGQARRVRIFVAEDDGRLRRLATWALRSFGFEVIEAFDGENFLDQLGSDLLHGMAYRRFDRDLLITDVDMQGWNGLAVLTGLRHAGSRIAAVLMTSHLDDETQTEAARVEAALLRKPFTSRELLAAVRRSVELVHARSEPAHPRTDRPGPPAVAAEPDEASHMK